MGKSKTHPAEKYGFKSLESLFVLRNSNEKGNPTVYRWDADGHRIEIRYLYKERPWRFDGYILDGVFISLPGTFKTRDLATECFLNDAYNRISRSL